MKDSCQAVIIWKDKILLFHRDSAVTIPNPDCWTLVGGGIEENETPAEAIQRELVEEAGYSPKNLQYLGVKRSLYNKKVHIFLSFVSAAEAKLFKKSIEGQGVGFFTYEEAMKLKLSPLVRVNLLKLKQVFKRITKEKKMPKSSLTALTISLSEP